MTEDVEHMGTLWFVDEPDGDRNWTAYTYKAKGDPMWRFRYRFWYDAGTRDPFDGQDRKSFWSGTENGRGIERLTAAMDSLAWKVAVELGSGVERLEINGPVSKLATMPNRPKWLHVKRVPIS